MVRWCSVELEWEAEMQSDSRGTWGSPEHRHKWTLHHRKKSPRNTITATIIFSYIILTSSFDVILLYLNNYPNNKLIKTYVCLRVDTVDTCKLVVLDLHLLGKLFCRKVHEHDWEGNPKSSQGLTKLTLGLRKTKTRNHSTANNFISLNTAEWKTQTSHTKGFKITATLQIDILFNIATPQIPMSPSDSFRRAFTTKW